MSWFRRRKPESASILNERELNDLYDEILLEPVTSEYLIHLLGSVPKEDREHSEWVMCQRTLDRIRRMQLKATAGLPLFLDPSLLLAQRETLYGLPIVVDEMALQLHLRVAS